MITLCVYLKCTGLVLFVSRCYVYFCIYKADYDSDTSQDQGTKIIMFAKLNQIK